MYGARNRPWSPPVENNVPDGRTIDHYLAHSSHGWATQTRQQDNGWGIDTEETFRRHRANLRATYEPEYDDNAAYRYNSARRNRRDREPSDVSVEALDLADYARTLRRAEAAQNDSYPYPPFNGSRQFTREPVIFSPAHSPVPVQRVWSPPSLPYPPVATVPVERPFSALSRDTMMPPPSLVSGTTHSSHTHTTSLNHATRRPFSLPADYLNLRGPAIFNTDSPPPSARAVGTGRRVPADTMDIDHGLSNPDISSFPPWARKWYAQEDANAKSVKGKHSNLPRSPVEDEIFGPYIHPTGSQHDLGLLPWNGGPQDEQAVPGTIPDSVKEERIRMLEREFGDMGGTKKGRKDTGEEKMIGGVDEKGKLITVGPKKRITVRVFQVIIAILTAVSGIYGALVSTSTNFHAFHSPVTLTVYQTQISSPSLWSSSSLHPLCYIDSHHCSPFLLFRHHTSLSPPEQRPICRLDHTKRHDGPACQYAESDREEEEEEKEGQRWRGWCGR